MSNKQVTVEIIKLRDKPVEPDKDNYYVTILESDDTYEKTLKDIIEDFAECDITDPAKMLFEFEEGTYGDSLYGHPVELGECKFYYLKEDEWNRDIDAYSVELAEWCKWATENADKIKQEKARQKQERKSKSEHKKRLKAVRDIVKKKQEIAKLESTL